MKYLKSIDPDSLGNRGGESRDDGIWDDAFGFPHELRHISNPAQLHPAARVPVLKAGSNHAPSSCVDLDTSLAKFSVFWLYITESFFTELYSM